MCKGPSNFASTPTRTFSFKDACAQSACSHAKPPEFPEGSSPDVSNGVGSGSFASLPSRGKVPACGHRLRPAASGLPPRCSTSEDTSLFLELFAGAGGLTAAVRRLGLPALDPQDLLKPDESGLSKEYDLAIESHFKELRSMIRMGKIRWLHGAPPCKTFSRARRSDRFAFSKKLRSDDVPAGFEPKPFKVREANLLATRMARLARCAYKAGGWFSIENPEESLMWKFSPLVSLAQLPGVSLYKGDQCALGGIYQKPTGWLSNAPWMNVVCRRCPPTHPKHPPLVGFGETFDGRKVWMTELAAEYSEDLCDAIASAYALAFESAPRNSVPKRTILEVEGASHTPEGPTKRVRKEEEADQFVGGLRNPLSGLRLIPNAFEVGRKVRSVLEPFVSKHWSALTPIIDSLGSENPIEPSEEQIVELRSNLASALSLKVTPDGLSKQGLQPWLFRALLEQSGDPEVEVPKWLETFTPLGIEEPIVPCNIFPECAPRMIGPESDEVKPNFLVDGHGFRNYTSYTTNQSLADGAMRREVAAGYAETGDIETLQRKYGQLVLSKIACIVNSKDGVQKVRLIHDLRRSAVNAKILLRERLVLPRLCDVVQSTLDLMEAGFDANHLQFMVADFRDAFKMLKTFPTERRFLAGRALDTYFVFCTVLFGVGTGPLVWCRVAAAIMRITQSVLCNSRIACFVDDPIVVLGGALNNRISQALQALLLWTALGAGIAWKKASFNQSVQWIGGQLSLDSGKFAVRISLPAKRIEAFLQELLSIQACKRGMICRDRLRSLAGLGSWIGGMAPQVKPFIRQIWGAVSARTKSGSQCKLVYRKQIDSALHWLQLFALGNRGGLSKTFLLEERFKDGVVMQCDASVWGGGAACWNTASEFYANLPPRSYFSIQWTSFHESLLQATIGDPAHQATFEAYVFLLAVTSWVTPQTIGRVILIGDALGVMHGIVQLSSKAFIVNEIAKELALHLAPLCISLSGIHIWGEENALADALSRLFSGKELPHEVSSATRIFPTESWTCLGSKQVR